MASKERKGVRRGLGLSLASVVLGIGLQGSVSPIASIKEIITKFPVNSRQDLIARKYVPTIRIKEELSQPANIQVVSYLGRCISPSARKTMERANRPTLCSSWCVIGEDEGESRWEVVGRGQLVNSKNFTIWTFGTLNDNGTTQEGNEVIKTDIPCDPENK